MSVNQIIIIAIVAIVVLCFLKGLVRIFFMLATLAGTALAGYITHEQGVSYLRKYWQQAPDNANMPLAIAAAILTFFILFKIFSFLTAPFENNSLVGKFAFGIPGTILSLLGVGGILWGGNMILQREGTAAELKEIIQKQSSNSSLIFIKNKLLESSILRNLSSLISGKEQEKHDLAKLLTLAKSSPEKYQQLSQNDEARIILQKPEVLNILNNSPRISQLIQAHNVSEILDSSEIQELLKDPEIIDMIKSMPPKLLSQ